MNTVWSGVRSKQVPGVIMVAKGYAAVQFPFISVCDGTRARQCSSSVDAGADREQVPAGPYALCAIPKAECARQRDWATESTASYKFGRLRATFIPWVAHFVIPCWHSRMHARLLCRNLTLAVSSAPSRNDSASPAVAITTSFIVGSAHLLFLMACEDHCRADFRPLSSNHRPRAALKRSHRGDSMTRD